MRYTCGHIHSVPILRQEVLYFRAAKITKNADFDKSEYSRYGVRFDTRGSFLLSGCSGFGKNVIVSVADMSSSVYVANRKDVLILGKGPTHELDDTKLIHRKNVL